jgi:glucose/mannose-6-phosphate isomerase
VPTREFEPERLDDLEYLERTDPGGVLREVASSAARVRMAHLAAAEAGADRIARDGRPRAIVVAGVGSGALAGDMLAAVCGYGVPVAVATVRSPLLPGWVGAADLVMAVSRTGAEEETVALAAEAARRGCGLFAVGRTGSPLEEVTLRSRGVFVPLPGYDAPPATVWDLAVPLVVAAGALGLVRGVADACEAAARRLEEVAHRCRPGSEAFINPGKNLALELADTVPMIWGSYPLTAAAARRFAGALHTHARYPAVWGELPEAGHTQIAAFDGPVAEKDVFADGPGRTLRLFLLRDAEESPRLVRCREAAVRVAEERGVPVTVIDAEGAHPLERLATLVGLCDFASVYLALGYGMDPARMAAIAEFQAGVSQ